MTAHPFLDIYSRVEVEAAERTIAMQREPAFTEVSPVVVAMPSDRDDFENRGDGPRLVRMRDIQPERVVWLWEGYIPAGKMTLVDGDPGDGKSTMSLDLAARLSTGTPMPDGAIPAVGNVLVLSAEDGIADTIRPRLDAAGADPARIAVFDEVVEEGVARPVELPRDVAHLALLIRQHRVRLVVIDPLMAFLGGVDSHNDQSVRRALHPLSKLADESGAAILVVRHLNKGSGKAMYRGGGSIGISGAARAVHLVAPDPDDESRRLLACVKSNLAMKPPTIAYRLVSDELHGVARVRWEGTTGHTADQLVQQADDEGHPRNEAVEFLRDVLSFEPTPAKDVIREAKGVGISERTLHRAKQQLRVIAKRSGFGPGSQVCWRLPASADTDDT